MTEKPDTPGDLVSVEELDPVERAYCRRSEVDSGKVSRAAVTERRRSAEGRALAGMRTKGESLYLRTTLERPGEPRTMTTEATSVVDLDGQTRQDRRR